MKENYHFSSLIPRLPHNTVIKQLLPLSKNALTHFHVSVFWQIKTELFAFLCDKMCAHAVIRELNDSNFKIFRNETKHFAARIFAISFNFS